MSPERKKFKPVASSVQAVKVKITGPTLASALTMCALEKPNRLALWIGKEKLITRSLITDEDSDGFKTEKEIYLEFAFPIARQDLSDLKLSLPKNWQVIGLITFRHSTKFFDEPTLWDRAFCRQLMSNISLYKGSTFVFSTFSKVGRATKVLTYLIDSENDPGNFSPVLCSVSNLADVEPEAYQEASSSNFSRLIRQPELQTGSNLTTARGEIFDQFQQLFMDVDEKTKQATKKKEQLVEELRQLTAQLDKAALEADQKAEDSMQGSPTTKNRSSSVTSEVRDVDHVLTPDSKEERIQSSSSPKCIKLEEMVENKNISREELSSDSDVEFVVEKMNSSLACKTSQQTSSSKVRNAAATTKLQRTKLSRTPSSDREASEKYPTPKSRVLSLQRSKPFARKSSADLFEECLSSRNLKEGREAGFESGSGQKAQKSLFGTEDYDDEESRASPILD